MPFTKYYVFPGREKTPSRTSQLLKNFALLSLFWLVKHCQMSKFRNMISTNIVFQFTPSKQHNRTLCQSHIHMIEFYSSYLVTSQRCQLHGQLCNWRFAFDQILMIIDWGNIFFSSNFRVTPVFTVSCVTGENLNLVRKFLNLVPPARSPMDQEKLAQECTEYQVRMCFPALVDVLRAFFFFDICRLCI